MTLEVKTAKRDATYEVWAIDVSTRKVVGEILRTRFQDEMLAMRNQMVEKLSETADEVISSSVVVYGLQ